MANDPMIEALVAGFVAESREICQRITAHVLALEHASELAEPARRQHYDDLARGVHTLKGNSDTFGFPQLAELAHRIEDALGPLRRELAPIPPATADVLLRAIDVFMARLAAHGEPAGDARDPALGELGAALGAVAGTAVPAPISPAPAPGRRAPAVTAPPRPVDEPVAESLVDWRVGPTHIEALVREVDRLRQLRLRIDEQRAELDQVLSKLQRRRALEVGELAAALGALSRGLALDANEAGDVVDTLEGELKNIAMLPLRWVLDPLQRAVRDLCRTLDKEARLSCVGAEISLDRRLLEALKGPLVHLVRNAVDHGIESPDARIAAGKHREGLITVRVERAGNLVVVEVEDDGAGIDAEAVRRQAVARGMVTADDAAAMPDRDVYGFLFRQGFSTRESVGEISGRGVGLDVVRAAIQAQAGHIDLTTTPGSGTQFVLAVPALLGATAMLVVRAGEQLLGIPMFAIESIRARGAGATSGRIDHNGHPLELVELAALLRLRAPGGTTSATPILIVHARGRRVAVAVDELVGDRDLVVRPLPPEVQHIAAYQGAAVQARGDLLLVLQPQFLVEQREAAAGTPLARRRALVVDDSLTARALHRTVLESGGFEVHTASSAHQALELLGTTRYDVVIVDVMMSDLDGIQLTARLRDRRETRSVPIVLVSANDTEPQRERGLAAGADAFLSKKDCISGRLLSEVAAAIVRRERP